jgi:hypothetical protein
MNRKFAELLQAQRALEFEQRLRKLQKEAQRKKLK